MQCCVAYDERNDAENPHPSCELDDAETYRSWEDEPRKIALSFVSRGFIMLLRRVIVHTYGHRLDQLFSPLSL